MTATHDERVARLNELVRTGEAPRIHIRMGLNVVRLSPTTILTMEMTDEVEGRAKGSVHGGILATFADVASAFSLWDAYDSDTQMPVTTDMHVRYYRQPQAGPLTAEAHVVHRGSRLLSTECAVSDPNDRVLSRSTATYMVVPFAQ